MSKAGHVIQNMESKKYLKHRGPKFLNSDNQYDEVDKIEDAESFSSFEHACYAAFWYADHSKKWRVIDTVTNFAFIHVKAGRFRREIEAHE